MILGKLSSIHMGVIEYNVLGFHEDYEKHLLWIFVFLPRIILITANLDFTAFSFLGNMLQLLSSKSKTTYSAKPCVQHGLLQPSTCDTSRG